MVKLGDQVTLTIAGPPQAVLDAQKNFTKIMRMLLVKENQREQLLTMFVDAMHERRERREREVASVLMDALLKKP